MTRLNARRRSMSHEVRFTRAAEQALSEELPEKVAAAVWNFIMGAQRENPQRVGKQLVEPLLPLYSARRSEYPVVYRILDGVLVIEIVAVAHRRDAYR